MSYLQHIPCIQRIPGLLAAALDTARVPTGIELAAGVIHQRGICCICYTQSGDRPCKVRHPQKSASFIQ